MFCPNCGKEINNAAVFCIGCGVAVPQTVTPKFTEAAESGEKPKNRIIGFILSCIAAALTLPYFIPMISGSRGGTTFIGITFLPVLGLLIAGMVFSIIDLIKAKRERGATGFAIAGLIIAIVGLLFFLLVVFVIFFLLILVFGMAVAA